MAIPPPLTLTEGDAVQLALHPDWSRHRLIIAGVALVGVSLIAVNPITPSSDLPNVQHRAVKLVDEATWSDVVSTADTYLSNLETGSTTASADLSDAFTALSNEFGGQLSTALTGAASGIENSLYGGWYGGDDGYVFGLFGGTVTDTTNDSMHGVSETGSTLQEISTALEAGQYEAAFSYFDTWSLETADHTLKSLLNPILDVTSKSGTTLSIPVELSQIQTNLLETFGNYTELKNLSDALLSPEIGVGFALSQDIQGIATDFSSGDTTDALTALDNLPSDLTNALVNGWDSGGSGVEPFLGLLTDTNAATGGLLQELLVTLPEQLAGAL
jgi:hypothetical protein